MMTGVRTFWVTVGAKEGILSDLKAEIEDVLKAIPSQQHRLVVDLTKQGAIEQLQQDSIALVNYKGLEKVPPGLGFELLIMDEVHALKDGNNQYKKFEYIFGSPDTTSAKLRFGMTGSAYHIKITDVLRPLAFVMGDATVEEWNEQRLLPVLPAEYGPGECSKYTDWYFRAKLPDNFLPPVVSKLLVMQYESPEEIVAYKAYSSNLNDAHFMDRGLFRGVIAKDPPVPTQRTESVNPIVESWAQQHLVPSTADEAEHARAYAASSAMSVDQAREAIRSYSFAGLAPQKAVFIVNHANYVHPADPIMVTYRQTEMGEYLENQFKLAWVNGEPAKCRKVYRVDGKTPDQQGVVDRFIRTITAARETGSIMPVLLGQTDVMSIGWNKLQTAVSTMYQAQLEDNPQMDLQAAQRIVRQGQLKTVHIYRVMMDTLADKLVLQKQSRGRRVAAA